MPHTPHAPLFVREMGLPLRFGLYAFFCLLLLVLDARYATLAGVRAGLNALIHPVHIALAQPLDWMQGISRFLVKHAELARDNRHFIQRQELLDAGMRDRATLLAENTRLRALLALPPRPGFTLLAGEVIETTPDPFARRIIINRGQSHGVSAGLPVVDATGLVGQVTRVYPWSAEVTLLTDRDQAAPVLNLRNGLRIIVSGQGSDTLLEVRFLDMHADLRPGDLLYTSGIDGIYPAGVPVARVLNTEPPRNTPFARAICQPLGGVGQYRHMAVLVPTAVPTPTEKNGAAPSPHVAGSKRP
ncbi:MAG: rod shape-determining protein MreC [Hydrogenophilales bacterium 28-61-23]|nr:MAG: rod shape-determining protein MreC [Hydrogenophilales bacterium 28-61-23]